MSVETISGSGLSGNANGNSADASFVMPTGIAVDGSNAVYVADTGGQRVRRIRAGRAETLAGGGELAQDGLWVAGDYADGPARNARFNQPYGIAIGQDGDVYVADYANHCIRRLVGGIVETFAGHPDRFGHEDGALSSARFAFPRAISFDSEYNLYVADRSVGIRCISKQGMVSTIPLPANAHLDLVGIAVVGSQNRGRIFASDHDGLLVIDLPTLKGTKYSGPSEGDAPFGYPDALVALDYNRLLFTDSRTRTIRLMHDFDTAPNGAKAVSLFDNRLLDAANNGGGYQDGDKQSALFDFSRGIGLMTTGDVVVSDTGNRRVRVITGLDARVPTPANALQDIRKGVSTLAIVGGSLVFCNTMWSDSIAGFLEGLVKRPVLCVQSCTDDAHDISAATRHLAELGLKVILVCNRDVLATPSFSQEIGELSQLAARYRQNILIVTVPIGSQASPWEQISGDPARLGVFADNDSQNVNATVSRLNLHVLDLSATILRKEMMPAHKSLFDSYEPRVNREGRRLIATSIFAYLTAQQPQ